jgi:hypothetical protein
MLDHTHVLDAARRFDPTGTSDIRSRFRSDMGKRWSQLRQLTNSAITSDNILGLGPLTTQTIVRSADPVHEFQGFIDAALTRLFGDGTWTQHYLDEAAARARSRAYRTVAAMGPAQFDNTHIVVNSAAAVELQGVVEAVSQRAVRAVSMGLLARQRPQQIARDVAQAITTVGKARSDALIDVSVNSAFNHMTLDTLKTLGFTRVAIEPEHVHAPATRGRDAAFDRETLSPGTRLRGREPSRATYFRIKRRERALERLGEVEVKTAGDIYVCPICQRIAKNGPYKIDTARGLIPAHPHCRCAFVPYFAPTDSITDAGPPDEPRDRYGKWTHGGGGGYTGVSAGKMHLPAGGLHHEDRQAVYNYSSYGYEGNDDLRRGRTPETIPGIDGVIARAIDALLNRSQLPQAQTVFRVVNHATALLLKTLKAGDTYRDKAFMSTSLDRHFVDTYIRPVVESSGEGGKSALMRIEAPSGTKALDISRWAEQPEQKEVLFARNTELKFSHYDAADRTFHFTVR